MNWPYHWLVWKDVGLRVFNRVGTRSIMEQITRADDYDLFMASPKKLCVVRNPWHRLCSVYWGLCKVKNSSMPSRGYPPINSMDDLLSFVIEQDPHGAEIHIRPYWAVLEGAWEPEDHELITMDAFMAKPPHGLPRIQQHYHKSQMPGWGRAMNCSPILYDRWYARFADKDFEFFARAEKSPLSTGGKQATDDGHEM